MKWVRPLILFGIGGTIYVLIELIARGRSHWTMFFVGALAFYLIGCINEHKKKRDSDAVADGSRSRDYNRSRTDFRDHSEHYIDGMYGTTVLSQEICLDRFAHSSRCCGSFCQLWLSIWMIG